MVEDGREEGDLLVTKREAFASLLLSLGAEAIERRVNQLLDRAAAVRLDGTTLAGLANDPGGE